MNIKPIRTRKDYADALRRIEALMNAKSKRDVDELEILATLADAYESRNFPIPNPDPVEAIKFRMEQLGLRQVDLASDLGGRNRVSEILAGKRSLSLYNIRRLHKKLRIPVESLVGTE